MSSDDASPQMDNEEFAAKLKEAIEKRGEPVFYPKDNAPQDDSDQLQNINVFLPNLITKIDKAINALPEIDRALIEWLSDGSTFCDHIDNIIENRVIVQESLSDVANIFSPNNPKTAGYNELYKALKILADAAKAANNLYVIKNVSLEKGVAPMPQVLSDVFDHPLIKHMEQIRGMTQDNGSDLKTPIVARAAYIPQQNRML